MIRLLATTPPPSTPGGGEYGTFHNLTAGQVVALLACAVAGLAVWAYIWVRVASRRRG